MDTWWLWALIALGILVVVGVAIWLTRRSSGKAPASAVRRRQHSAITSRTTPSGEPAADPSEPASPERPDERPRAAVVVNPTKFDALSRVRSELESVCRTYGWADPLWLETTEDDPGYGQTKEALEAGVDLVCALGGDGTVRVVGSALVGSDVPMGLLSGGTGNLLARNLSLPSSATQGMVIALTGQDHHIDTATLRLRRPTPEELTPEDLDDDGLDETGRDVDAPPPIADGHLEDLPPVPPGEGPVEDHIFLVIAGLGFDAEIMANAPEDLKKRVGWFAYLVSALKRLRGPQFKVTVRGTDLRLERRVRSVMVSNVGKLTGGVNLVPQAKADDGILDLVLLSPEGLVGWGAVASRVITRRSRGHDRVDYFSVDHVEVVADEAVEIQLDGDTLGKAVAMTVAVNPRSLIIRRP